MKHNYGMHGKVKANRGKVQYYLGITSDFKEKGKLELLWATILKGLIMISY